MVENSKIEWTDHTFNPWWGCTKVSPGCTHCYAETLDRRTGDAHWGPKAERRLVKDWAAPRRWNRKAAAAESAWQRGIEAVGGGDEAALTARGFIKPRRPRVFCASMADVFDDHPSILPEWRARLWTLIRETPHLDWLLLTKRPQNVRQMLPADWGNGWGNVWLGTSAEDQAFADERIPHLLAAPAARRFVSCEPLLGPIDLRNIRCPWTRCPPNKNPAYWPDTSYDAITGHIKGPDDIGQPKLDWVIVGGESGPKARPMHPDWARDLRAQCYDTGTAFFFKQWGEWAPTGEATRERLVCRCGWSGVWGGAGKASCVAHANECQEITDSNGNPSIIVMRRVGKKAAGRLLDGQEHNEVPE